MIKAHSEVSKDVTKPLTIQKLTEVMTILYIKQKHYHQQYFQTQVIPCSNLHVIPMVVKNIFILIPSTEVHNFLCTALDDYIMLNSVN